MVVTENFKLTECIILCFLPQNFDVNYIKAEMQRYCNYGRYNATVISTPEYIEGRWCADVKYY